MCERNHVVDGLLGLLEDRRGLRWTDAVFKRSTGHRRSSRARNRSGARRWAAAKHMDDSAEGRYTEEYQQT